MTYRSPAFVGERQSVPSADPRHALIARCERRGDARSGETGRFPQSDDLPFVMIEKPLRG